MCRARQVDTGTKEYIERLRGWAKKNKAWAMALLADRYRDGRGVKQSDPKMIKFFKKAAEGGNACAQFSLGQFYDQGIHGLPQSSAKAFEYYTLAAKQGMALAQNNLGTMYAHGQGIEQSYSKARKWWTKAAAQGDEVAINTLKQLDILGL